MLVMQSYEPYCLPHCFRRRLEVEEEVGLWVTDLPHGGLPSPGPHTFLIRDFVLSDSSTSVICKNCFFMVGLNFLKNCHLNRDFLYMRSAFGMWMP